MTEDEPATPSIRRAVPSAPDWSPCPAGRLPEQVRRSSQPEGAEAGWVRLVKGATAVVFALCVAYGGVEAWGAGVFKLNHEGRDARPGGYFLVVLGVVMVFVLPVLLLVLGFRGQRAPRVPRDPWADAVG